MDRKTLLVTGSSRGIGAATAVAASSSGWNVCVHYREREDAANEVVDTIRKTNPDARAIPLRADLTSEEEIRGLFQEVDREFGSLDGLVNNAGILGGLQTRVEDLTAERIRALFEINVTAPLLCCREAIRRMSRKNGGLGGSIINISSIAARLGAPNEYVDYAASKGALDTLTRGLALEVAQEGIRVNGVRPGTIVTEIHATGGVPDRPEKVSPTIPLRRPGEADEVAHAVVWLLSDGASYVTGSILDVSGGK